MTAGDQGPFVVVLDEDGVDRFGVEALPNSVEHAGRFGCLEVGIHFFVDAHQVLSSAHDAGLERGRAGVGGQDAVECPCLPCPVGRCRCRPWSSSPTSPAKLTSHPSARRFRATLAAPPGRQSRSLALSTGTGASGLMRSTLPIRYWSTIRSPSTRMRNDEAPARPSRTDWREEAVQMVLAGAHALNSPTARSMRRRASASCSSEAA